MTFSKFLVIAIAALNTYFGLRFFLNVVNVLHTTKYSKTATAVFAFLFLGMGLLGIYFSLFKHDNKLGLWIGIGPWALALVFLLVNMLAGDYK